MQISVVQNDARQESPNALGLMIVSRLFGASGQPWMWRQVVGLNGFRKELVCWQRMNADTQPTDLREHVLSGDPAPYDGHGRWRYRARTALKGNFYAAVGNDEAQLTALINRNRPSVILCHFGDIAMRVMPVARRAGVPLVAYLHGDFSFMRNRWYRWSFLRSLPFFSAIVVVTGKERDWLLEHGVPANKIHLVPCGAPTDIFIPNAARPNGTVKFIMASRLSDDKGCDISIKAFARIAPAHSDARLSIFGDGPQRAYLEQLTAELGLEDKVIFHGYVGEEELSHKMPLHDIFIQHSRIKEGSPVAIVEAMACGLPVVSTPVGGIVDQIVPEENGLLVAEGDVTGMADAMARLAADEMLRRRFGLVGRVRAVTQYDAARQTARLGEILMSAAKAQTSRS